MNIQKARISNLNVQASNQNYTGWRLSSTSKKSINKTINIIKEDPEDLGLDLLLEPLRKRKEVNYFIKRLKTVDPEQQNLFYKRYAHLIKNLAEISDKAEEWGQAAKYKKIKPLEQKPSLGKLIKDKIINWLERIEKNKQAKAKKKKLNKKYFSATPGGRLYMTDEDILKNQKAKEMNERHSEKD